MTLRAASLYRFFHAGEDETLAQSVVDFSGRPHPILGEGQAISELL